MSWDKIDNMKEGGQGGGLFIALKDKETVEGVFRGEPYVYYGIFKQKEEYPAYVPGSSFKFKINFLVKENGQFTTKILNQGITMAKTIRTYLKEYGENQLFKIERQGATKDDTSYFIYPKGPLSAEDMVKVKACKLQTLKPKHVDEMPPMSEEDVPNFDSRIPF